MFPFPHSMGPAFMPPPLFGLEDATHGKTRYRYVTPDGGPPNDGAPPPRGGGMPFGGPPCGFQPYGPFLPSGNCVPGANHPFGPPPNALSGIFGPPPPGPPGWFCAPTGPPSAPPAYTVIATEAPKPKGPPMPPPPTQAATTFRSVDEPEEPVSGNRVKGKLMSFPDKHAGYIFPKRNVTIHLFSENILLKYQPNHGDFITTCNDKHTVNHAPCSMTVEELILQLDCEKRANHHPPYNQPGQGYTRSLIGIQQLYQVGSNQWRPGSKIMLTDPQAGCKLEEVWSDHTGDAGGLPPVWLVRLPV